MICHSADEGKTTRRSALPCLLQAAKLARSAIRGGRSGLPRSVLVALDGVGLGSGSREKDGVAERPPSDGVAGGVDGSADSRR